MLIFINQPINHGGELLHTASPPPHRQTPLTWGLSLWTLNIRNGQESGITQAIKAAQIGGVNVMILMETNITDQDYCLNRLEMTWCARRLSQQR